ncbi:PREDICTED: actin-related protein 2/3 complex subunit 5-like protein [Nicrophorus vespilloides]|uniref:Actin-related protein 2/3 complex subunit 5 n=1 Tax=Nicrophorus vespilloides TaxID=110193 RepID=A0ABM1M5M4_NICVS|nr:PREDICTED: actin-related protein 2/3 complex subunit 5-like protein [Nicrophorus vespilloides]
MAKNTSSSAFRKIDVDQYCEDNFKEDDSDVGGPTGPDETEVLGLLNKGQHIEALRTVLMNAPLGSKNQLVKENALNLTLKVLLSIKTSQIDEAIKALGKDYIDVLMKYVYKGFEMPSEGSSGHLLVWHEKAYNVGGVGSIIRVLADSKRA